MLSHLLFLTADVALLVRAYRHLRLQTLNRALVSGMGALIYLTCLWLPGALEVAGELDSKLQRSGALSQLTSSEFSDLALRWSLEICSVGLVEMAVVALSIRLRLERGSTEGGIPFERWALPAYIAISIGLSSLLLSQQALTDRGQTGNGVGALLNSFFVSGLAIVAYYWPRETVHRLVVLGGFAFLATSYVRSPLIVLAVAFVMGAVHRGALRSRRSVALLVAAALVLILASSVLSAIRGELIRGGTVSNQLTAGQTLSDPLVAPFQGGVDTLDGYRVSQRLAPYVTPVPLDPLMSVGGFVPRSLWRSKPDELSIVVSRTYLGYKASGQFLSPVGYLTLSSGGYGSAILGLSVFVALMTAFGIRAGTSLGAVVVSVIVFRFFIGGAAFDVAYGLRIAVPWVLFGVATGTVSVVGRRRVKGNHSNATVGRRESRHVADIALSRKASDCW